MINTIIINILIKLKNIIMMTVNMPLVTTIVILLMKVVSLKKENQVKQSVSN